MVTDKGSVCAYGDGAECTSCRVRDARSTETFAGCEDARESDRSKKNADSDHEGGLFDTRVPRVSLLTFQETEVGLRRDEKFRSK